VPPASRHSALDAAEPQTGGTSPAFSQHTGWTGRVLLAELVDVDVLLLVVMVTVEMVLLVVLVVLLIPGSHWPLGVQTASGTNAPPALVQPL
jgi:hypothetical protein